ncbi:MAG: SPOR domain-containing protein [Alphaproteobacteria bacterium]|nr:SPOR domain-containing protein [Alphaproteobacteria bacterium]
MVAVCALGLAGLPHSAMAQPVVQPIPGGASQSLNSALTRLARDPRDLSALINAGNAALSVGDVDAAVGFFTRADQLSPNNMRVKAGLAGALVRSENPYDAIPLFAEADKAGVLDPGLISDRGLAYDLVGDNANAQRYYRQSLAASASDETLRRLALSQAIAGNRAGMEATLAPLLQKQDQGAWRTRAFALAILRRPEEAVAIANRTMPATLASGIAPYLRYMLRLTPAQQAAAANFGRFPRAAEIGQDDPRVARYAPTRQVVAAAAAPGPAPVPADRGKSRRDKQGGSTRIAASVPATVPVAAPAPVRSAPPEPMPARQAAAPPSNPQVAPAAAAPISAPATPQPDPEPAVPTPVPNPLPTPVSAPQPAPRHVVAAPTVQTTRKPERVADAFADFAEPTSSVAPAPGAVDVRKIKAKPKPKPKPVEPPKPVHPSRIWVQVGIGRDTKALGFTWRRLVKENPAVFRGQSPSISDLGRTNRLLAGPFSTQAAADSFLAKLRKADVDAFAWTSPTGQVVDDLPGK